MNERYIIVIEVDHLKAKAAYQKGIDRLEEAWPFLEKKYKDFENQNREIQNQLDEQFKKEMEQYEEEIKKERDEDIKYQEKLEKWNKQCSWTRGVKPFPPDLSYRRIFKRFPTKRYLKNPYPGLNHLNFIKSNLKEKLNLATLAQSNFKMTEIDVKEMLEWESGEKVEELKNYSPFIITH